MLSGKSDQPEIFPAPISSLDVTHSLFPVSRATFTLKEYITRRSIWQPVNSGHNLGPIDLDSHASLCQDGGFGSSS